jgi:hypothetical protein
MLRKPSGIKHELGQIKVVQFLKYEVSCPV